MYLWQQRKLMPNCYLQWPKTNKFGPSKHDFTIKYFVGFILNSRFKLEFPILKLEAKLCLQNSIYT